MRESVRDPHFAVEKTVRGTAMTAGEGPVATRRVRTHPTAMRRELGSGRIRRSASGSVMSRAMTTSSHFGAVPVVFTQTRARIELTLMTATGSAHSSPSAIHGWAARTPRSRIQALRGVEVVVDEGEVM